MACSESPGAGMKISESKEKKPKSKNGKLLLRNGMRVSESHEEEEKPKSKKRKLSTRLSKFESEEKTRKRKSRIEKSYKNKPTKKKNYKNKPTKKKNAKELLEEELKEREIICGGTVVAYDRDDPDRYFLGKRLKSLVSLAIDFYNKNNSTDYRLMYLVRAIYESCQGALYYMTMTVKLPNQDDSDAITLEAEIYRGIPNTIIEISFVRVLDAPPLSHVST